MKTAYNVVSGAGFDAGSVPAGPLQRGNTEPRRELVDQYSNALSDLLFEREGIATEKEQREAVQLIGELSELHRRASELMESVRARARVQVTAEWEAAKAEVREQQEKIQAHHAAIAELQRELNRANDARGAAFAQRDSAQEELRRMSRYVDKRTHEKASELLAKREREADSAAKASGELQARINFLTLTESKPLADKLNELMAHEAELRHYATGESFTNSLGIVVPPRPPI